MSYKEEEVLIFSIKLYLCYNKEMKKLFNFKNSFFLGLILLAIFSWLYFFNGKRGTTYTAKELESIEVQEYEGLDLSSINDFRENSIKGPQYIDKDNYKLNIKGLKQDISYSYSDIKLC